MDTPPGARPSSALALLATVGLLIVAATVNGQLQAAADEFATAEELSLMQGFPPRPEKRINKSNALFTPPFNRWSYLNMRSVYPSAGISHADNPVPLTVSINNGIDDLTVKRENGEEVGMKAWLRETYTDAVVVVHGDRIVWEKYSNGMDANHVHQMMSVTKSFAGLFGLMAVADGKVAEDEPVTKYIPELAASTAFAGASFRQVLDMTNSMSFSEDYADPESGIVQYAKVLGLMEAEAGEISVGSIYEYLVGLPVDDAHEHGEIFHYQTPKTDVVNWVTNRATDRSFMDYFAEELWARLGTDGETYVLLDKNGTLFAGGGLNATPYDLARFGLMMINNGKFNGEQVVSPSVIQTLTEGADTEAFHNGPNSAGVMSGGDWSYRAQWWVRHTAGREAFTAIGIHGQWIYLDVERNVAIIKQSSQPVSSSNTFDEFNINAFDSIISYLSR